MNDPVVEEILKYREHYAPGSGTTWRQSAETSVLWDGLPTVPPAGTVGLHFQTPDFTCGSSANGRGDPRSTLVGRVVDPPTTPSFADRRSQAGAWERGERGRISN